MNSINLFEGVDGLTQEEGIALSQYLRINGINSFPEEAKERMNSLKAQLALTIGLNDADPFITSDFLEEQNPIHLIEERISSEVEFAEEPEDSEEDVSQNTLVELEAALTLDPNSELSNLKYAIALSELDRDHEALPYFKKVAEIRPGSPRNQDNLGDAYLNAGDYEKAIPAYEKAIELGRSDPLVFFGLAEAYYQSGDIAKTIEFYKKFIEETKDKSGKYAYEIQMTNDKLDTLKFDPKKAAEVGEALLDSLAAVGRDVGEALEENMINPLGERIDDYEKKKVREHDLQEGDPNLEPSAEKAVILPAEEDEPAPNAKPDEELEIVEVAKPAHHEFKNDEIKIIGAVFKEKIGLNLNISLS